MGGGISISVEEIDNAPPPNATPSDALNKSTQFLQTLFGFTYGQLSAVIDIFDILPVGGQHL